MFLVLQVQMVGRCVTEAAQFLSLCFDDFSADKRSERPARDPQSQKGNYTAGTSDNAC